MKQGKENRRVERLTSCVKASCDLMATVQDFTILAVAISRIAWLQWRSGMAVVEEDGVAYMMVELLRTESYIMTCNSGARSERIAMVDTGFCLETEGFDVCTKYQEGSRGVLMWVQSNRREVVVDSVL